MATAWTPAASIAAATRATSASSSVSITAPPGPMRSATPWRQRHRDRATRRLWAEDEVVIGRAGCPPDLDHVGEAACRDQGHARRGVLQDGVGGDGGAVQEAAHFAPFANRHKLRQRVTDRPGRVVGRAGHLQQAEGTGFVAHHGVGEGAADVDPDVEGHSLRLLSSTGSRSLCRMHTEAEVQVGYRTRGTSRFETGRLVGFTAHLTSHAGRGKPAGRGNAIRPEQHGRSHDHRQPAPRVSGRPHAFRHTAIQLMAAEP